MRGPHNLWRLIRTGATFERTGAMSAVLAAFDAPPALRAAARVLGWPFQWLGYEGDPTQPPILRALTALGPAYIKFGQLLSTRPDVVDHVHETYLEVGCDIVETNTFGGTPLVLAEYGLEARAYELVELTLDVMKWNYQKVSVALGTDAEVKPGELADLTFDEDGRPVT